MTTTETNMRNLPHDRRLSRIQAEASAAMVATGMHPNERQALDRLTAAMKAAGFVAVDQAKLAEREAKS